jgi:diguanylate cyclase (GGDEF)-like protein
MAIVQLRRPVIGILPAWPIYVDERPDHYSEQILQGILTQARSCGIDLLLSAGIGRLAWPEAAPDCDFAPIGPWNTDGLIVFTPLDHPGRSAYIQKVRASGHPIVFLATGEEGPSIHVDNTSGIREAIAHLAAHGHRRIAFIAGTPEDAGDTAVRLAAYRQALEEFGLEYSPQLVAYGRHKEQFGYTAMKKILASGEPFTAVQASNDTSAIGALTALREAGIQVPSQVAMIGFDDQPDSAVQVPALTSLHTPLVEMGAKAVEHLLARIQHGTPLEPVVLPAHLVRRQSCGCLPDSVLRASCPDANRQAAERPVLLDLPAAGKQPLTQADVVERLQRAILPLCSTPVLAGPDGPYARLVLALVESITHKETSHFDQELHAFLQSVQQANGDVPSQQDVISALRFETLDLAPHWPDAGAVRWIEDLFQRARVTISEIMRLSNIRYRFLLENTLNQLSVLTAHLSGCLDPHEMVKILDEDLPRIGIRHARLMLFEPSGEDPYAESIRVTTDSEADQASERFPTHQFPPAGLYPEDEALSLAVAPLVFQNEPLGYIAFDSSQLASLPGIVHEVAANLKAAQLHAAVVNLSLNDDLTGVPNRRYLELFLSKELARHRRFYNNLSIIMADLDDFKTYNDTFGHLAGDKALKTVARCLQKNLREADMVARYGGDEFMLVLVETDEAGALTVARHIRTSLAEQAELARPITLSMGIVTMTGGEDLLDQLITRADDALYQAKNKGKDRACVSKSRTFQGKRPS